MNDTPVTTEFFAEQRTDIGGTGVSPVGLSRRQPPTGQRPVPPRKLLALLVSLLAFCHALPAVAEDSAVGSTPKAQAGQQTPSAAELSHPSVTNVFPYQPQGATATPKIEVHWDRYHDYLAATGLLQKMAHAFPDRTRLVSLGRSYGNRQMWVLEITNFQSGADTDKPAMWIDGGIHANEIQPTEVVLYTAWYLLEMYDRVPAVRQLVDQRAFYLMPMMSPDSRDAHFYQPNSMHSPRSGQRPIGDARDGAVRNDPRDDLDRDGSITEMRIRDPNGRMKPDTEFPQLMVPAKPDEKGSYTMLGSERFDRPGQDAVPRVRRGYYDPNRDWGWHWEPDYVQVGGYRYPFSILENRMVADFIMAHRNIAGGQSYHNAGGLILRGPGVTTDHYDPADLALYNVMGKRGERMLPGYRYIAAGEDMYQTYGVEFDWLYMSRGIFAFTNELFTSYNYYRDKVAESDFVGSHPEGYEFNRDLLLGAGIVPWHEVEHPLYGRIEVGGYKKNWTRQPPAFLLEEECHRNMAFSLYQAEQMPRVKVQSIDVKPLDGGLGQVTAVISNERMLPTHAAVDVAHDLTPPDLVTLSGANMKVLAGLTSPDQFFIAAAEQKRRPETLRFKTVPSMGAVYARWIVRGGGPYTVRVDSYKGGKDAAVAK